MISPHESLKQIAIDIAGRVVAEAGSESVETVFAGGSLATDEIAVVERDQMMEFYSDIDLYVLIRHPVDVSAMRDVLTTPDNVTMINGIDVGFYSRDDLLSPGYGPIRSTLASDHIHLFGAHDIYADLARIPAPGDNEALYLLENRVAELTSAGSEADSPFQRYQRIKCLIDTATACSIVMNVFSASIAQRIRGVEANADTFGIPEDELSMMKSSWEQRLNLQSVIDDESAVASYPSVMRVMLNAWKRIARVSEQRPFMDAVRARCREGDHAANLREFIAMRRRLGFSRLSSLRTGAGLSRFSPGEAIRISQLLLAANVIDELPGISEEMTDYFNQLTSCCDFSDGDIAQRTLALYRKLY